MEINDRRLFVEEIQEAIMKLPKQEAVNLLGIKIVKSSILKDNQVIIKVGNTVYLCNDFTCPEDLKVIEVPDMEEEIKNWKPEFIATWK